MSKASSGMKLVKWLASQADNVAASADDLKRFGPQAARVRSLLDFIPTMSDDARLASNAARRAAMDISNKPTRNAAFIAARDVASNALYNPVFDNATGDAFNLAAKFGSTNSAKNAAFDAAFGEVVGNRIAPEASRILTDPLAAGRAVDILGSRPRNQGLPFYDIVRQMGQTGVLRTPRDVVVASRLAKAPDNVREVALFLMNNNTSGMTLQDILTNARLLA